MNISKMKVHLQDIIVEMIQEHSACENDKIQELMDSWDDIVKEYRTIADFLRLFVETDEDKDVVKLMKSLHYVRCHGMTPEEHKKEVDELMDNDDSGGIW